MMQLLKTALALRICFLALLVALPVLAAPEAAPPETPREFYNAGTRQLGAGKLREAEASWRAPSPARINDSNLPRFTISASSGSDRASSN